MADAGGSPDSSQISKWLRDARDRAGLTRRQVSDRIGVTEGAIQNWENEEKPALPPADQFLALVVFYRANVLELLASRAERPSRAAGGAGGHEKPGKPERSRRTG